VAIRERSSSVTGREVQALVETLKKANPQRGEIEETSKKTADVGGRRCPRTVKANFEGAV